MPLAAPARSAGASWTRPSRTHSIPVFLSLDRTGQQLIRSVLHVKGRGGRKLDEVWADGPHTYLGISIAGFPNFFTITGPQSPSVLSNMPVSIEQHVEWIADCIEMMSKTGKTTIEATPEAQEQWGAHVNEMVNTTLMPRANSRYMSANIAGKPRAFLPYLGPEGVGGYRRKCDEVATKGYDGFTLA